VLVLVVVQPENEWYGRPARALDELVRRLTDAEQERDRRFTVGEIRERLLRAAGDGWDETFPEHRSGGLREMFLSFHGRMVDMAFLDPAIEEAHAD
jgi:hypothetical protein